MNKRTLSITVFVLLCVACVVHAFYYYPRLPDQVAHHFGASGQPDAWGSKTFFLIIYLVTVGYMAVMFLGICFTLPKIPKWMISFPNKDYWLAPEHRQQTLNYLFQYLMWLGSLTMSLFLIIFHQSFLVHLGKAVKLNHLWIIRGVYLALFTVWIAAICMRFSKKKIEQDK